MLLPEKKLKLVKIVRDGVSEKGRPWAIVKLIDDDFESCEFMLNTEESVPISDLRPKHDYRAVIALQQNGRVLNATATLMHLKAS